ncbi:WD40-repeat-containing domain protein [Schizophyllum amplum]|uniref:Glutamate-rich WD repeat-containing protein 1 n=1 Tax=Schizophyllum amplum TaxID=97359 RepID=A0A550CM91_9AGAR|nr:WD40-repeat-containing domain protein [Auriculariopsis ampla]
MSKRTATETLSEGQAFSKASGSGVRRPAATNNEMGEFEDQWEDEIESDEEVVDAGADEDEGMDVDGAAEDEDAPAPARTAYIPGSHTLGADEVLEADDSVYIMRHTLNVRWPCLSFDVLRDGLGDGRQRFPATAYLAAGTQADAAKNNELLVYKLSSLHKTQRDADDSESDDDEDDDALDEDAVLEYRSPLPSGSGLPPPSQPYYTATWSETGKVHIWDVRPLIEGFAMDWAASGPGALRLLTGDVHAKIFLTTASPTGFTPLGQPFAAHTSSVEDLQWSPSEPTVFASCSADASIRLWDVRAKGRRSVAALTDAHESDVNVISWNRSSSYLLVSGGDDGALRVWDLRSVKQTGLPATCPRPVTSVEWHPTEDSVFAASGADDQVTLWDLAVEQDEEELGGADMAEGDVPPQLLFVHQGQKDVKEVHWHPQIPGAVISTAFDSFNIFKTISV